MPVVDAHLSTIDTSAHVWPQKDSGLSSVSNTFKLSQSAVAERVLPSDPASSKPLQWVIHTNLPSTFSKAWPQQSQVFAEKKWHILTEKPVRDFCNLRPGVDIAAMQQIHDLLRQQFGSMVDYNYEMVIDDEDESDSHLILNVSAENLSMDQLIAQELKVFDVISRSNSLSNANKYHIISIA